MTGLATLKLHLGGTRGLCHQLLCKEIVLGHFSLCDLASYTKWMEEYAAASTGKKEQMQLSSFQGYQKSLEALCNFGSGFGSTIEETPKVLDPPKNIEDIILSLQHGLLRSATTHSSKGMYGTLGQNIIF